MLIRFSWVGDLGRCCSFDGRIRESLLISYKEIPSRNSRPLPHAQLYPIIERAHLVVLPPSLMDNLPNACLEAMTLGKPVVVRAAPADEIMITDGENGFLVSPNEPEQLARKINAPHGMIRDWNGEKSAR